MALALRHLRLCLNLVLLALPLPVLPLDRLTLLAGLAPQLVVNLPIPVRRITPPLLPKLRSPNAPANRPVFNRRNKNWHRRPLHWLPKGLSRKKSLLAMEMLSCFQDLMAHLSRGWRLNLGLFTRRLRAMHPLSFLDQKDLENVLLPNSCLSQFHINAALHVMGQTYKDVRFLDSFWDVYAGLDLRGKKAALWIHYDSDRKHWRLVVFPPDSVDVFILDSLTYSQDDQDAIKVHYAYASDLPEPYWDIHWIETPKQTDGFSCGLFCLWWAISLAASSSPIPDDRCRDWSLPSDIRLRLYDLLKPTVEPRPDLDIGSTVLVHRSALSESKLPDSVNEDTVLLRGKIFRRLSPFKDFQVDFGDHIQDVPVYGFLESTWQERHETLALARRSKVFAPVEPGSNQFVLASIAHDYSGSGQVFVKMPNQKAYAKLRRDELVWAAPRTVGAFLSGGEQQTRGRRPGNKRTKQ